MTNEHDEEKFLAPLRDNPDDLHTWGVYADWLEEHGGRPATAEMIRRKLNTKYGEPSFLLLRDQPHTEIGYATAHPTTSTGEDHVFHHLPSGQEGQVFYTSNWMPRKVSKRLIPQLHKEGMPLRNPNEGHDGGDVGHYNNWIVDTATQPDVHQMSRDKPLVVSYRRNAVKKYASSTVARVMGHGQYANEMGGRVVGSRIATVLREIKHGVGSGNDRLGQLTTSALGGSSKPELYTAIRDELFRTKDPRAVQLARQYNWHKVGEGLERDNHLKNFVMNSAKGTSHENDGRILRRFYNGVVHQKNGPDNNTRQLFYKAMRKHLQNQTGKDHTYEEIEDSLRRLGETEENHEKVKTGGLKGGSKFESPDYQHPAYTGVPKEGKFPPKKQITPIEKRAPGQYRRNSFRFKL